MASQATRGNARAVPAIRAHAKRQSRTSVNRCAPDARRQRAASLLKLGYSEPKTRRTVCSEFKKCYESCDDEHLYQDVLEAKKLPAVGSQYISELDFTDLKLANEFKDRLRGTLVNGRVWNEGTRTWSDDDGSAANLAVYSLCQEKCKPLRASADTADNPKFIRKLIKEVESGPKIRNIRSIVEDLLGRPKMTWDHDPFILGIPGGKVVDLKTGDIREAKREDFITKYAGAVPSAHEDCPRFHQFLSEILPPNMIPYVKRLAGYALTGSTKEEMFALLVGEGENGKGTLMETLLAALGTYGGVIPFTALLAGKKDRHPTEIAKLEGLRLAISSETSEGREFNEGQIKTLTGGDTITARGMRKDFQDFKPTHKLLLASNNAPELAKVDKGFRRRLHLCPFNAVISAEKKDLDLKKILRSETSGILRWMIDGCLEWQQKGLQPPQEVLSATEEYFDDQDLVGQWLSERCDLGPNFKTTSDEYYADWEKWRDAKGEHPVTRRSFTTKLKLRGFKRTRVGNSGDRGLQGFKLKSAVSSAQAEADEKNAELSNDDYGVQKARMNKAAALDREWDSGVRDQLKTMFTFLGSKAYEFGDLKLWEKFGLPAANDQARQDLLNRGVREGWIERDPVGQYRMKGR